MIAANLPFETTRFRYHKDAQQDMTVEVRQLLPFRNHYWIHMKHGKPVLTVAQDFNRHHNPLLSLTEPCPGIVMPPSYSIWWRKHFVLWGMRLPIAELTRFESHPNPPRARRAYLKISYPWLLISLVYKDFKLYLGKVSRLKPGHFKIVES